MSLRPIVRHTILALVGIALLIAHTGCVQVGPTAEPVMISFACSEEEEAYYASLLEAFGKEHRHITVEFVRPQRFQWPDADVFDMSPFSRRFMDQDGFAVLDLRPYLEHDDAFARQELARMVRDLAWSAGTSCRMVELRTEDQIPTTADGKEIFMGRIIHAKLTGKPDIVAGDPHYGLAAVAN